MAGRPTPTQDELNKIALGQPVELADDGSGPDQHTTAPYDPKAAPKAPGAPAHTPAHGSAHETHQTPTRSKA
jgi:hypothetical protein